MQFRIPENASLYCLETLPCISRCQICTNRKLNNLILCCFVNFISTAMRSQGCLLTKHFYMRRKETSLDTRYGVGTRKPATGKTAYSIHRAFLFYDVFIFSSYFYHPLSLRHTLGSI